MNFVPSRLNIPLFLVSRLSIHKNKTFVHEYISRKTNQYLRECIEENEYDDEIEPEEKKDSVTIRKYKHIAGLDERKPTKCRRQVPMTDISRQMVSIKPWHLAPNRYDVPGVPYAKYRGSSGAYWCKLHKPRVDPRPRGTKAQWRFYDLPCDLDKIPHYKGVFVGNARDRVSAIEAALRAIPGPGHYEVSSHTIANNTAKRTKTKKPNPHVFIRNSIIPARPNSNYTKHTSFLPGPGRYEVRYPKTCACAPKLNYSPDIYWMIDKQKRLKFRRLPYIKIRLRQHCTPEGRHIAGHGHTYLFKAYKKSTRKKKKEAKKLDKLNVHYPEARYIAMVNNPLRADLSLRLESIVYKEPLVRYNCIAKRIIRKQLRMNKKIAFMSGQPRFQEDERPPVMTTTQLEQIKTTLPEDRRLQDHPIWKRNPSDIKSDIHHTPKHMECDFVPLLRKRLFKFLPLPTAKVLITEKDLRPESEQTRWGGEMNITDFLKESVEIVQEAVVGAEE